MKNRRKKIIKQLKDNYSIDENDFENCKFVNKNINQNIFELSKEKEIDEIKFSIIAKSLKTRVTSK